MKNSSLIPCLQVSPIDVDQAISLAELIADFNLPQWEHSSSWPQRNFWVCYRRDTDAGKIKTIEALLKQQFNVYSFAARNFADGHPAGPNALWFSAITESWLYVREGWSDHQAFLTFEADCVPLQGDWIDLLEKEWRAKQPAQIVGHLHADHINGNAMFCADFVNRNPHIIQNTFSGNWDYANRELFTKVGKDTDLITQLYRQETISEEDFVRIAKRNGRPCLLHGIKDLSAQKWARKHLYHPRYSMETVQENAFSVVG